MSAKDEQIGGLSSTQEKIAKVCDEVKQILLDKNRKYGDSAMNPIRIFSKSTPVEQLNVRIDDKISRLVSGQADDTEDVELDLIGYLVLKRVQRMSTGWKVGSASGFTHEDVDQMLSDIGLANEAPKEKMYLTLSQEEIDKWKKRDAKLAAIEMFTYWLTGGTKRHHPNYFDAGLWKEGN